MTLVSGFVHPTWTSRAGCTWPDHQPSRAVHGATDSVGLRAEVDRLLATSGRPLPPAAALHGPIVALSGRNQLHGIVDEVRSEGLLAQVRLRIGDQTLTAVITRDAIDELKLRRGDEALAVIKSTEVMIARQVAPSAARARATRRAPAARRRR